MSASREGATDDALIVRACAALRMTASRERKRARGNAALDRRARKTAAALDQIADRLESGDER